MANKDSRRLRDTQIRLEAATAEPPIKQRDTPDTPPSIDAGKMLAAWNANVETQREVIRSIERNEANNEATAERMQRSHTRAFRFSMTVLGIVAASAITLFLQARETVATVQRIEAGMGREMSEMRASMATVADAMAALNEAEVLAATQRTEPPPGLTISEPTEVIASSQPKRDPVVRARRNALAKAYKAQARLVDDMHHGTDAAKVKIRAIRVRAAEAGVPLPDM